MQSGVRATWHNAHRGFPLYRDGATGFVACFLPVSLVYNPLARQRAFNENCLAVPMRDAASFLVERLDVSFEAFAAH